MNPNDNQQHKKDITLNSAGLSLFNGDNYFYHVFKKTQKILSATYLITDFISDTDPIKLAIRDAGLGLYKTASDMSISASPNRKFVLDKFFSCGLSLISFCQVAAHAGLMSVINYEIMSDEIRTLMQVVEDREVPQKLGRNFVINKDSLQTEQLPQRKETQNEGYMYRTGIDTKQQASQIPKHRSASDLRQALLEKQSNGTVSSPKSLLENDSSRKQKIVDLIKMKGEVSIKDISDNFLDCSEKTIQRELISLVESGVIFKAGERRWSRYSIKK